MQRAGHGSHQKFFSKEMVWMDIQLNKVILPVHVGWFGIRWDEKLKVPFKACIRPGEIELDVEQNFQSGEIS